MSDPFEATLPDVVEALPYGDALKAVWRCVERIAGVPDLGALIKQSDDDFMVHLAQRLERVEVRAAEKVDALEARELALMAIDQAHRTADAEKRRALSNVVVNALAQTLGATEIRAQLLLRTIAALEPVHLYVLRTIGTAAVVVTDRGHAQLCSAPDGQDPEAFARRQAGIGAALSAPFYDVTGLGRIVSLHVDESRLVDGCQIDAGVLRKVLIDLEAQGLVGRHQESEPHRLFVALTSFGVHLLLFAADAEPR